MRFLAFTSLILATFWHSQTALARKTNQPVYEDPFDVAAGGASLTRASKEGMLFSNPAQLAVGGKFFRWFGLTTTVLANKESLTTAKSLAGGSKSEGQGANSEFVEQVFKAPVRAGWGAALSLLTETVGVAAFSRFEPDIRARKFGQTGLPELEFQAESYHGIAAALSTRTPWRPLYLGMTAKYLYANEPDVRAEITDQETIAGFQDQKLVQDFSGHNKAFGVDAGALLFFQGKSFDFVAAGKVDDLGNTKFTGPNSSPTAFKQVTGAGVGLTLHTGADALHFAADVRDLEKAYGEELFKRSYLGMRATLRTYLGFAAGYYNGYPSLGAEIDLILLRLAATTYTRELGDHPGVEPRHIYMLSLSMGF